MAVKDFKLDSDGDLLIKDGDFVIGESDAQHIKDIMQSLPGWFKKFPLVGFNPYQYVNARNSEQEINANARKQLEADGYKLKTLKIAIDESGNLTGNIDATRV